MRTREQILRNVVLNYIYFPHDGQLQSRLLVEHDIYDILNALTEEQRDCKFCHPEYSAMKYQNFKYCPHCGRPISKS